MGCNHEHGGKDWARMSNGVTKLHPYCRNCGTIKNISSDRAMKLGFFVAALSRLKKILRKRGYKISEAQIRLIVNELSRNEEFCDRWWITYSRQREIFIKTVQKYVRVSRDVIEAVTRLE